MVNVLESELTICHPGSPLTVEATSCISRKGGIPGYEFRTSSGKPTCDWPPAPSVPAATPALGAATGAAGICAAVRLRLGRARWVTPAGWRAASSVGSAQAAAPLPLSLVAAQFTVR